MIVLPLVPAAGLERAAMGVTARLPDNILWTIPGA